MKKSLVAGFALLLVLSLALPLASQSDFKRVKVKAGDTLSSIAREHLDDPKLYKEILKYNNIADPNWIYTGDILVIPGSDTLRKIQYNSDDPQKLRDVINESKSENFKVEFDFREQAAKDSGGKCSNPDCPNCGSGYRSENKCAVSGYEFMDKETLKKSPLKLEEVETRLKYQSIKPRFR